MAPKGLTECWREAMAAKPSTWKRMGVVFGPPEVFVPAPRRDRPHDASAGT